MRGSNGNDVQSQLGALKMKLGGTTLACLAILGQKRRYRREVAQVQISQAGSACWSKVVGGRVGYKDGQIAGLRTELWLHNTS